MPSFTSATSIRQSSHHQGAVIAKLEDIFESIADQMLAEKPFVIPMKSRLNNEQALDAESGVLLNTGPSEVVNITWPGATQRESWKFSETPTTVPWVEGRILTVNLSCAIQDYVPLP